MLAVERVQIMKPDEFDCMFTCKVRSEQVYSPSPSKNYAALQITSSYWEPEQLLNRSCNGERFVCPKAFKSHFRRQIEIILQSRASDSERNMNFGTLFV